MDLNKVYHSDYLDNKLQAKCAQLIIADPPYFEVKGEFDFVWKSFDEYLKDVEKWAIECKRILADNGTLFWYGHAKKLAYTQVIIDKYFNLENNIAIEFNRQTKKGVENFRCFAPVSERLLMYSNEIERTGLEEIKLDINNFQSLRQYFKEFQTDTGLTKTQIIEKIGQVADHCFRWGSTQWDLPTKETYTELLKLPNLTGFIRQEYEALRQEYEALRQEYEALRRPFNNYLKLFDIMSFDQEAHITGRYDHDTCKPETLTRALILTCSRKNDLVVVPFAGSGTECAMAKKEGRKFIGFEKKFEYVQMSNKRVQNIQAELFQ